MIPRVIHQFWDRPEPPADVRALIARCRTINPDWAHVLWSDESAAAFIEGQFGSDAVRCFRACRLPAVRADVLRLAVAVILGGAYVDAGARMASRLDAMRKDRCVLYAPGGKLMNGFFMTPPQHFFFVRLWNKSQRNIRRYRSDSVSALAGPGLFAFVWKQITPDERASISVLGWPELRTFMKPDVPLSVHATEGHWSVRMGKEPIIDVTLLPRGAAGWRDAHGE